MVLGAVYLPGDLGLRPIENGSEPVSAAPLALGPWAAQGRPFDGASVVSEAEAEAPGGTSALRVDLGPWHGSLAEVVVDGERVALLGWPPRSAEVVDYGLFEAPRLSLEGPR